jgi:arginine repressor
MKMDHKKREDVAEFIIDLLKEKEFWSFEEIFEKLKLKDVYTMKEIDRVLNTFILAGWVALNDKVYHLLKTTEYYNEQTHKYELLDDI